MTIIACMHEMTWLMHDMTNAWQWLLPLWWVVNDWRWYHGLSLDGGLKLVPDTSSGLNGCRCSSGSAWVAWRYRENLPLCILSCPSLLGIWSALPWLRLTYWYRFSLSERYAPRLSHSETCLVGPTRSLGDLPHGHKSLFLIGRTPRWFAPD